MIKYLMRRTIYKELDKESQHMFLQLNFKKYMIEILCSMFWAVAYIFPFIPLYIINVCEDIKFSMTTQMVIIAFTLISLAGFLIFMRVFNKAMFGFSHLLAERIYFLVCTTKGKAFCKNELRIIKQVNEKLYELIATQMCRGYCYSICFEMCKSLKKGAIEFLAVKKFSSHDKYDDDDGKNRTMHVIYVNNGWAFDTYSSRQYPIEKLHEIYNCEVYKTFSFDEISSKFYEEFRKEQEPELVKWCIDNDCSMFGKGDK